MAYQIKRIKDIVEDIELLGDNGAAPVVIHVSIKPEAIAKDFRAVKLELVHAQQAINRQLPDAIDKYRLAVISMLNLVLGEDGTNTVLAYFDNDVTEAAIQFLPFIIDVVQPAVENYAKSRKAIIANNYKLSRKQRRNLGV